MKFYVHVLPFKSALMRMDMEPTAGSIKYIIDEADVWDNYYVCDVSEIRAGCFKCDNWYVPITACDVDDIVIEDDDRDSDDTIMELNSKLRSIEIKLKCAAAYADGAGEPGIAVQIRNILRTENLHYFDDEVTI